jgi:hypothetical protein
MFPSTKFLKKTVDQILIINRCNVSDFVYYVLIEIL